jgi:hypothetical protein
VVDDGRERRAAHAPEVRDRERAALHLLEARLAVPRALAGLGQFGGELRDGLLVDVAHDRHEQAPVGVHRDTDVDVLLDDDLARRHVDRGVELRKRLGGRRSPGITAVTVNAARRLDALAVARRSSSEASALSNCVTCRISLHARLRCSAVFRRTLLSSACARPVPFEKSGADARAAAGWEASPSGRPTTSAASCARRPRQIRPRPLP